MAARSDASGGGLKNAVVQRVVGVVALVVTTLVIGAARMGFFHLFGSHEQESVLANKNDEPAASAPVSPAHASRGATPDGINLDEPAVEPGLPADPAPGRRPGAQVASAGNGGAPVVTAVTPDTPRHSAQMAHLDEHVTYQYNAIGRRDPFQSLLSGDFVGADVGGDAPPDPGGMKIVGIVWGASDQFAMVEDVRGNSYVLRKGDKLQNGYVESLRRDAVVVNVTADGQSQQVVIPFVRKGDEHAR